MDVNVQIYGKSKCFDTRKAERYFKERGIKYQYVDILKYGLSRGEFENVKKALGLSAIIDEKSKDSEILRYLAHEADKEDKVFENQRFIKTPVVRNGKKATVGYEPEVWAKWE